MTDFFDPLTPANPAAPAPRTCRRHDWSWIGETPEEGEHCRRCGRVRDVLASKRSRNNRSRGNRFELRVARDHADGVKVGHHGGAADVLVGDMFVIQAKYFAPGRFPGWMADELARLPRTGGRVPLLIVGEAAGQGRKGRVLAIVDYADWRSLHGETP